MPQVAVAPLLIKVVTSVAVSLALTAVSSLLQPKPRSPARRKQDRTLTVRQAVAPRQIIYGETVVAGTIVYMASTDNKQFLHLVVALARHECEEISTLYFGDEEVPYDGNGDATGKYAGLVRIQTKLGTSTQTAFSDLVTESGGEWTANHRLQGVACAYIRLKFDANLFPSGVPNIRLKVKGRKVFDPRVSGHDPVDSSTWEWSDNSALCVADYLTSEYGLDADYSTEIDETDLIAAANVCDETVALNAGGTESRYTINGAFLSDEVPKDVLPRMLESMAGTAASIAGVEWHIHAGAYRTPTITLDESDLAGPISVQTLVSRRNNFNAVKGVFRDPERDHQLTDFPIVTNSAFEALDNDERITLDVEYEFTNSHTMAQRLATIRNNRQRQALVVNYPTKVSGLQIKAGDTVMIDNDRWGWTGKVFDVVDVEIDIAIKEETPKLNVNLTLRETAASVYTWNMDESDHDPAPNTSLPNPFEVANPTALAISTLDISTGSDTLKTPEITWTAPADGFVTSGGSILIEWKRSSESKYRPAPPADGDITQATLPPVENGTNIDVRLKSVNSIGIKADSYVEITGYTIGGAGTGPTTEDWGLVTDIANALRTRAGADVTDRDGQIIQTRTVSTTSTTEDWGLVTDTVSTTEDWGGLT